MEDFFRVCYEKCVLDIHGRCLRLFQSVHTANPELNAVELRAELETANRILEIANPTFFFLNKRHPEYRSHLGHNIQVQSRKLANPDRMALPRNAYNIQLMRLLTPNILQIIPIIDLSTALALKKIKDDIIVRVEHKLGLIADEDFRIGVDQVYILVLEDEEREGFVFGFGVHADMVFLGLCHEDLFDVESY